MREDRLGIETKLAHERLPARGDMKLIRCCHTRPRTAASLPKNRLMPGLKNTFPSTTTSSSSRKSCTALLSVRQLCFQIEALFCFTSSSVLDADVDVKDVLAR